MRRLLIPVYWLYLHRQLVASSYLWTYANNYLLKCATRFFHFSAPRCGNVFYYTAFIIFLICAHGTDLCLSCILSCEKEVSSFRKLPTLTIKRRYPNQLLNIIRLLYYWGCSSSKINASNSRMISVAVTGMVPRKLFVLALATILILLLLEQQLFLSRKKEKRESRKRTRKRGRTSTSGSRHGIKAQYIVFPQRAPLFNLTHTWIFRLLQSHERRAFH